MVRKVLLLVLTLIVISPVFAQYYRYGLQQPQNDDRDKKENTYKDTYFFKKDNGFWFSAEAIGGYSANVSDDMINTPFAEIDLYVGYRINEFVRVGLGMGPRYYFMPKDGKEILRRRESNWSMPIMLNLRGNFIPQDYRTVVPYYSLDIGGAVTDGFMLRPTIGIRCGERRSAFLLGISYMLQNMRGWGIKYDENGVGYRAKVDHATSFFALRLGYEF